MKKNKIYITFIITLVILITSFLFFVKNKENKKLNIEEIKKSIVYIIPEEKLISFENNPGGVFKEEINFGLGTGFFCDKKGTIITAYHVVNNINTKYYAITFDNKKYETKLIYENKEKDIAKIKINLENYYPNLDISISKPKIGEKILSFGFLEEKNEINYVLGKISKINISQDNISNLIEFSPKIKPGFSGGPIINNYGKVIGINYSILNSKSYGNTNLN